MAETRYGHRSDIVFTADNEGNAIFASAYRVVVYRPGTVVTSFTGSVFTVPQGHDFVSGDMYLLDPGGDNVYGRVSGVTATTITTNTAIQSSGYDGALMVNLGADGGSSTPNYDAGDSYVTIYSEEDGTAIDDNTITCDSYGQYEYWTKQRRLWELVLDTTLEPVGVNRDVVPVLAGVGSPVTFTDGDTTPSVLGGTCFQTANTGAPTITDFDDAYEGQRIVVLVDSNTTISFVGANMIGNGGVSYSPDNSGVIDGIHINGIWYFSVIDKG